MASKRSLRRSRQRGRQRVLGALAVAATLLVPAAVAWACNPQAVVQVDRASYAPGDTVRVQGTFFAPNSPITLETQPGGFVASVTSNADGAFQHSFRLASDAPTGGYTLTATAITPNGTFRPQTFFLVGAPSTETPPSGGDPPPSGGDPPLTVESPDSSATEADEPQPEVFTPPREPATVRSNRRRSSPGTGSTRRRRSDQGGAVGNSGSGGGASTSTDPGGISTGGAVTRLGRDIFAGSLARADRAAAAGASRSGDEQTARSGRPSERTAMGDLWSGFGDRASLIPSATDPAAPDGGPGAELALGVGLLGLGLVGLLSGLAVAEVRRRRASG